MMQQSVPREEEDTICNFDGLTKTWSIYSCAKRHITKLRNMYGDDAMTKIYKNDSGVITAVQIDGLDFSQVSFRKKSKKMTEEQKEVLSERLKKARESNITEKVNN